MQRVKRINKRKTFRVGVMQTIEWVLNMVTEELLMSVFQVTPNSITASSHHIVFQRNSSCLCPSVWTLLEHCIQRLQWCENCHGIYISFGDGGAAGGWWQQQQRPLEGAGNGMLVWKWWVNGNKCGCNRWDLTGGGNAFYLLWGKILQIPYTMFPL